MAKILSAFLALTLLLTGSGEALPAFCEALAANVYALSAPSAVQQPGGFEAALADMLSENKEQYFSQIVVDTEQNTVQRDGEEPVDLADYGIDYAGVEAPQAVVPAVPVLERAGEEVQLRNDGTVERAGEADYSLLPAGSRVTGKVQNGYIRIRKDGKSGRVPVGYLTQAQAEKLGYKMRRSGVSKIIVTKPYQTKRLIADMKQGKKLKNTYGAKQCITDGNGTYVLQFSTVGQTEDALQKLQKNVDVQHICADEVVKASALRDRGGAVMMNSDRYKKYLKDSGKTAKITVAVVDTGVETSHPLLKGRTVKGYNVFTKKTNAKDENGHGTHVAGIVADNTPSSVKIMPVRVMDGDGSGTDLSVAAGIDRAVKSGAKVINLSLGSLCTDDNCPVSKAVKRANKAGVAVCVAAGNDTNNTKYYCPARMSQVITVASATVQGGISAFSNYGAAVDVAAPGDMILSSYLGGRYETLSGTSMAAPFASAAAAMLLTDNAKLTPAQVKSKLKSYCADMGLKGWDKYSGAGVINLGIALGDNKKADEFSVDLPEHHTMTYFKHCTWYMTQLQAHHSADEITENAHGVTYQCASLTDRTVKTSTTNSKVAYFDGRYIVPKGAGKATIKIWMDGGKSLEIPLTVKKTEVWIDYAASKFAGGKGTKKAPYLISTPQQLAKLSLDVRKGKRYRGKYFKLTKDIDLKGKMWQSIDYVNFGAFERGGWIVNESFNGIFDGGNHKVKNMHVFDDPVQRSWGDTNAVNTVWYSGNYGLFGYLQNCTVKNVGVENGYSVNSDTGLLASDAYQNTKISNCYTTGECGGCGLINEVSNFNIQIKNCFSTATVREGGLFSHIYSSSSSGGVTIANCYFAGEQMSSSRFFNSGGFANHIEGQKKERFTNIYNCFSASNAINNIGFAYKNTYGNIYGAYYLKGNTAGIKKNNAKNKTHLKAANKAFFQKKANYTNKKNWNKSFPWDFKNTWAISKNVNGGLPYLKKNKPLKKAAVNTGTGTWVDYAASKFAGGNGTKSAPYLISNAAQLARVAKVYRYGGGKGVHFKLTANISLKAHPWFTIGAGAYQNGGEKFLKSQFFGSIDGAGHTISDMKITDGGPYCGFISQPAFSTIKNLHFKNAYVEGSQSVGILCGMVGAQSQIIGCSTAGTVKGKSRVGGIASDADVLLNCHSSATVIAQHEAGGLCTYLGRIAAGCVFEGTLQLGEEGEQGGGICNSTGNQNAVIQNCVSFGYPLMCNDEGEIVTSYDTVGEDATLYTHCFGDTRNIKQAAFAELTDTQTFDGWNFEKDWYPPNGAAPLPRAANYCQPIGGLPTEKWTSNKAKAFAGGKGTYDEPYLIATAAQLAHMQDVLRSNKMTYFRQVRDIDLGGKLWWGAYDEWYSNVQMTYDGGGHNIKNLRLKNGIGLFPFYLTKGQIANVHLEGVYGSTQAGLLAWNGGRVVNCSVKGTVAPPVYQTTEGRSAGIVGINDGVVERCSFEGTVYGGGGIAGDNDNGTVQNCYTRGTLHNGGDGITPSMNGEVQNCYTTMRGSNRIEFQPYHMNCYSASDACCYFTNDDESALRLADLTKQETYQDWNFSSVWTIANGVNEGLPTLRAPQKRRITYVSNGGTMPKTVDSDYLVGFAHGLSIPTKKGYKLEGWYTDKACTQRVKTVGGKDLGDVTVYAKWQPAYTVKFNANGGKGSMSSALMARGADEKLPVNQYYRTGYTFIGWAKSKNGKVVYKNKQAVKNLAAKGKSITLYAVWKPHKYFIAFFNGSGSILLGEQHFTYGTAKTLKKMNTHPPKGKKFIGWTRVRGGNVDYKDGQKVKNLTAVDGGEVEFYAVYK